MPRLVRDSICTFIILSASGYTYGGGAINNQNFSSDYVRTLGRNAAIDAADIVFYNPAGVTHLKKGFTIKGDLQYITKDYDNTIEPPAPIAPLGGDGKLLQDKASFVPGVFMVYNQQDWAAFFGVSNVGGGGKVEFKDGNWTSYQAALGALTTMANLSDPFTPLTFEQITSHNLDAESTAIEWRFGGALALNEYVSLAAGLRYVDFERSADGSATLTDLNGDLGGISTVASIGFIEEGEGIGGFIGATFTPNDKTVVGFRYETETDIEVEQKITKSEISVNPALSVITDGILAANDVVDGAKLDGNLPAILGIGMRYAFTKQFSAEFNYTRYFDSNTDLELNRYEDIGDSREYGLSFEFIMSPELKFSLGILATRKDLETENLLAERPELNANSIGLGTVWSPTRQLDLSLGLAKISYDSEDYLDTTTGTLVEFGKDSTALAAGISYTFE